MHSKGERLTNEEEYKNIIRKNLDNTLQDGRISEFPIHKKGKVREIHCFKDAVGEKIVMVATDRVSAFDYGIKRLIPFKGQVLNMISNWAFANTQDIIQNAALPSPHPNVTVQKNCKNLMIECVVRGYVWGSLANEYEEGKREVCGVALPEGLLRYQKLDTPIFTPTTKTEHDEPMTFTQVQEQLGKELAEKVKDTALKLFARGSELAQKRGLVFIDTKYEFGLDENNELTLIDEANTADSSRYCTVKEYEKFATIEQEMQTGDYANVTELLKEKPERKIAEMSKQFVRDVLVENGFSYGSTGDVPNLTPEQAVEVSYRYIRLYETLTGKTFPFPSGGPQFNILEKLQEANLLPE